MIDLYFLSVILFFAILAAIIIIDRKNIDFKYILIMRRTKRFSKVLDTIAKKSVSFWKAVGTIAFVVCMLSMIYGTYMMVNVAYLVFTGVITQPAVQFALPIPFSQNVVGPGFIGIPFWFWIIVIAMILIPHETMHGIVARAEGIRLKDVGLLLLGIFPGAFVEPDEKQLEKSKVMTKLRIFSSGSFTNIFIGVATVLLVQSLIWQPGINGILITSVNQTSPAGQLGLEPGMVLESIDGKELEMNFYDYSFLVLLIPKSNTENVTIVLSNLILSKTLGDYEPGDVVTLKVDGRDYETLLAENPNIKEFPYIGIGSRLNAKYAGMFEVVLPLLAMISSLSILVGIFNILPIYPLDGGLIVKAITERYLKKKTASRITLAITYFLLVIIIYSFARGFFNF